MHRVGHELLAQPEDLERRRLEALERFAGAIDEEAFGSLPMRSAGVSPSRSRARISIRCASSVSSSMSMSTPFTCPQTIPIPASGQVLQTSISWSVVARSAWRLQPEYPDQRPRTQRPGRLVPGSIGMMG